MKYPEGPLKIGGLFEGALSDSFFNYAIVKALSKAYPGAEIEIIVPAEIPWSLFFEETFKNQDFCKLRYCSYDERFLIKKFFSKFNWREKYDIWAGSIILYGDRIFNSPYKTRAIESLRRQEDLHGPNFHEEPYQNWRFYNECKSSFNETFSYLYNIPVEFQEAKEVLDSNLKEVDLNKFGLLNNKYITVHQGSSSLGNDHYRCFPVEYWEKLNQKMSHYFKIPIVQIGKDDNPLPGVDINLVNKSSLWETVEILRNGLFNIGINGLFIFMSALLNHKCYCIHGGPATDYWKQEGDSITHFLAEKNVCPLMPCGYYLQHRYVDPPIIKNDCFFQDRRCMNSMSVDKIFDTIQNDHLKEEIELTVDIDTSKIDDNKYVSVISNFLLENSDKSIVTIKEWLRIIKPGGTLNIKFQKDAIDQSSANLSCITNLILKSSKQARILLINCERDIEITIKKG